MGRLRTSTRTAEHDVVVEVDVVHAAEDHHLGNILRQRLHAAGIVTDDGTPEDAGARIILMSDAMLATPHWLDMVGPFGLERLVPVQISALSSDVPQFLRELNWIIWNPAAPEASVGQIFAAATTSLDALSVRRRIERQAEAWLAAGQDPNALASDLQDLEEARAALERAATPLPGDRQALLADFIERSIRRAKAIRLRRRATTGTAMVALVAVSIAAAIGLPYAWDSRKNNWASIAFAGENHRQMPEWSGLSAATVLLTGNTEDERTLARTGALEALGEPWAMGHATLGGGGAPFTVDNVVPLDHGRTSLVLGSVRRQPGIRLIDTRTNRERWTIDLDDTTVIAAVDPTEAIAAVATMAEIVIVDLEGRRLQRSIPLAGVTTLAVATDGTGIAGTGDGQVFTFDRDGVATETARESAVLDVGLTVDGSTAALVVDDATGAFAVLDGPTGVVTAPSDVLPTDAPSGGLVPGERAAIVVGEDRRLWSFDASSPAAPSGIPTAERNPEVRPLGRELVAVGGQDDVVRVVHLPTGHQSPALCRQVYGVHTLTSSVDRDAVSCNGPYATSVYSVPTPRPASEITWNGSVDSGLGSRLRLTESVGEPVLAAFDPTGRRAVLLSERGDIVVAERSGANMAVVWRRQWPDLTITDLGWVEGTPYARDDRGNAWAVPDCVGCSTDDGLIEAVRTRLAGCWYEVQTQFMPEDALEDLEVVRCKAIGGGG